MHSRVKVLIVRHGEREDEALRKSFLSDQKRIWDAAPRLNIPFETAIEKGFIPFKHFMNTLDPLLTLRGYSQAQSSFSALMKVIDNRKVAVFCSPLRRTIGTALMIGTVTNNKSASWPLPKSMKDGDDSIPITVINELGDFATHVYEGGGCLTLVPKGSLRCADMAANDATFSSPMLKELSEMQSHLIKAEDESKSIRFWKLDESRERGMLVPMSPPLDPSAPSPMYSFPSSSSSEDGSVQKKSSHRPRRKKKQRIIRPDNPMKAVRKAVLLTMERGCDTCVIVAHREAIYAMLEECNFLGGFKAPYCCVGSFDAIYNGRNMIYELSNVWNAKMLVMNEPRYVEPRPLAHNRSNLIFMVPGFAHQLICTVEHNVNGKLSSQIWLDSEEPLDYYYQGEHFELTMTVVDGQRRWIHFLRHALQNDMRRKKSKLDEQIAEIVKEKGHMIHGWVGWKSPEGRKHKISIRLDARVLCCDSPYNIKFEAFMI